MFKKNIIFLISILLLPIVFSAEESFSNSIKVNIFNGSFNITTEQDTHIYSCMSQVLVNNSDNLTSSTLIYNNSNSFTFILKRNVSSSELQNELKNFTGNVNNLMETCDQITKQYGDINT